MRPRYLLQFNANIIEKPSHKVPLESKTKERENCTQSKQFKPTQ